MFAGFSSFQSLPKICSTLASSSSYKVKQVFYFFEETRITAKNVMSEELVSHMAVE